MRRLILLTLGLGLVLGSTPAPAGAQTPTLEEATEGLVQQDGFIPLFSDPKKADVFALVPAPQDDGIALRAIHQAYVSRGLGSNPVGLDRSRGARPQIVAFRRIGDRVVIEAENTSYRAISEDAMERNAVDNAFARSILWSGAIVAESDDGDLLINISDFIASDVVGIADQIKARGQGNARLDATRSMADPTQVLVFPENIELEAILTFAVSDPGYELRQTTPVPDTVTLGVHHSFVQLPDDGYEVRYADERVGVIDVTFQDYASPITADVTTRLARRFRLKKTNPEAARSPVEEPIVWYVDRGVPEPIRSALMEGAGWWAAAFEAAGFIDAFQVALLPEDAHPLDARYNVINWVHRQTRGWSYGAAMHDPRTGEVIKGYVLLGSLRVRQDRMIFEALAGADATGSGGPNDPAQVALARVRQLAAHEVGHPLGFAHNMAASTYDRASVMDYPAPRVRLGKDGEVDFTDAYAVGVGPWDKHVVKWLYTDFPDGTDEEAALDAMVADAQAQGMIFVSDADSRPVSAAHPKGNVWDNGSDAVAELATVMDVRAVALDRFGARSVKPGQPLSDLRRVIVPLYLYHRYQVAAAAKSIGGIDYAYKARGDDFPLVAPVPAERQRAALQGLLATIEPSALDLSNAVLAHLPPSASPDYGPNAEVFENAAYPAFDLSAAADSAASLTLGAILHPARLARVSEQHARDGQQLSLTALLEEVSSAVFARQREARRLSALRRVVQSRLVATLIALSGDPQVTEPVRSAIDAHLRTLAEDLRKNRAATTAARNHQAQLISLMGRHASRPAPAITPARPEPSIPMGSPIGAAESCWHCDPLP